MTYLLSIVFLSTQLVYNMKSMYETLSRSSLSWKSSQDAINLSLYIILQVLPIILTSLVTLSLLPRLLTSLTLLTNLEMLKDPALLEAVIVATKLDRSKRSHRIFQVMKLIRRQLAQELRKQIVDKRLRGVTKKHIVESFQKVGATPTVVRGDAIKSLTRMCGQVLDINEERILLKKSRSVS